jgi:hypothetical protein
MLPAAGGHEEILKFLLRQPNIVGGVSVDSVYQQTALCRCVFFLMYLPRVPLKRRASDTVCTGTAPPDAACHAGEKEARDSLSKER